MCSNSGHIQQFRVEAISLRAGRVSLCSLDSPPFHLSAYLFAYQGIPDPASCRAGLRRADFFVLGGMTVRVRVFLKYVLVDPLSYSSAPGPSGIEGVCPDGG